MLLRRARGILTSMALGAIPWAALGCVIGIANAFRALPGGRWIGGPLFYGSLIPTLTFAGAIVGAVNGAAFGVVLMIAERRRTVADLRTTRIGLWSALATGGTVLMISGLAIAAGVAALLGFGVGAVVLRLAQRRSDAPHAALDAPAT